MGEEPSRLFFYFTFSEPRTAIMIGRPALKTGTNIFYLKDIHHEVRKFKYAVMDGLHIMDQGRVFKYLAIVIAYKTCTAGARCNDIIICFKII